MILFLGNVAGNKNYVVYMNYVMAHVCNFTFLPPPPPAPIFLTTIPPSPAQRKNTGFGVLCKNSLARELKIRLVGLVL